MQKTVLPLILIVLVSVLISGCVQMQSETILNKDGSGTSSLTLSLSTVLTEVLAEMQETGQDMSQEMDFSGLNEITREDLEEQAADHGVKITAFKKGVVDGRQTLSFSLDFADLEGLSYIMSTTMGQEAGGGMGLIKMADGNYKLQPVVYDFESTASETPEADQDMNMDMEGVEDISDMAEMDPEMMQKQMELMGRVMAAMDELFISMKITVPGDIISSNAHRNEGRTCIWEVTPENMMTLSGGLEPEIVFSP